MSSAATACLAAARGPARADQVVLLSGLQRAHGRAAARGRPARTSAGLRRGGLAAGARASQRMPGERLVSVFCYDNAALADRLLERLARPADAAAAHARRTPQRQRCCAGAGPGVLRGIDLPWLSQTDYDRLLWACDLNFVRGEDSLVRALVGRRALPLAALPAARWRPCAQARGLPGHVPARRRACPGVPLRRLWRAIQRPGSRPAIDAARLARGCGLALRHAMARRDRLVRPQPDLVTQLMAFVEEKR